jgi:hypothetical protein
MQISAPYMRNGLLFVGHTPRINHGKLLHTVTESKDIQLDQRWRGERDQGQHESVWCHISRESAAKNKENAK